MCGIAGIVGVSDVRAAEAAVLEMTSVLERRGPDDWGVSTWNTAVLGHRRLSIFDLSAAGRQPMVSPGGNVGIVFNGSIYNYVELRRELIARGWAFRSDTDTEVLVHGFREWGLDTLVSKIRGMFAFGIWDAGTETLYLVRDRLGVKPLVFTAGHGTLAFASTVRALRSAGFVDDIDETAVLDFLRYGFVPNDSSIYRNAIKVPPGSIVEWSNGSYKTRQYWSVPVVDLAGPGRSFDEALEETESLLLESVEIRLRADVPVGALLSGGVDSALVCWAIAKLGGDITAYTIGTPGDPSDETAPASQSAKEIGIDHRVLEMAPGDAPEVAELSAAFAEPFACASALGMLRVSQAVVRSAKVLLTGDGGDDLFLGYPRHRHLRCAEMLARAAPSVAASSWAQVAGVVPRVGPLRRVAALCDYAMGGLSAVIGDNLSEADHLLGERFANVRSGSNGGPRSIESGRNVLTEFIDYERRTRFLGEYLPKVDGATMHYGLEARSPFLDHGLWEFGSSLPIDLRLRHGRLKAILRELARRRIGRHVAFRRKRGFSIPVQRWLVGRWRPTMDALMRESLLDKEGWVRSSEVLSQIDRASRRGVAPNLLWYVFVLESWLRHEKGVAGQVLEDRKARIGSPQ